MKITLFTLEFPPQTGGVAKYYGDLADNWQPTNDFTVLTSTTSPGIGKYFRYFKQLEREYQRGGRYFMAGQILPLGTALYFYAKWRKIKYVLIFHGLDFSLATKNCSRRYLTKKIMRRAQAIISANSYTQKQLIKLLPAAQEKIFMVNPGVSSPEAMTEVDVLADRLSRELDLKDKQIIFSLGRLVARKGFDNLITAFKENKQSEWRLILAGAGPQEAELKELAKNDERIIFRGQISETEKWAWLKLCQLFALVSRDVSGDYEGFGIVYLEAALMGKAVLAGKAGGVTDAVLADQTGCLIDGSSISKISNSLKQLLADDNLREKLGRAGKERAMADFMAVKQVSKIQRILNS